MGGGGREGRGQGLLGMREGTQVGYMCVCVCGLIVVLRLLILW